MKFHRQFLSILDRKEAQLIGDYEGDTSKVWIKCKEEHRFERTPMEVIEGKWCRECRTSPEAQKKFRDRVLAQGGFICGEYITSGTKIRLYCSEGHEFYTTPDYVGQGNWCPKCRGNCPKEAQKRTEKVIAEKGGRYSGEYVNGKTPLDLTCAEYHNFKLTPNRIQNGAWCPFCNKRSRDSTKKKVENIISEKGGSYEGEYINGYTKLDLTCGEGHEFQMTGERLKAGSWCPECRSYARQNKIERPSKRRKIKNASQDSD